MTTKAESAPVPGTGEITRLLAEMREGDSKAAEELLSHVYRELRILAACKMAHESPGQTLQPTALVHEAWLRLGGGEGAEVSWPSLFLRRGWRSHAADPRRDRPAEEAAQARRQPGTRRY